MLRCYTTSQDTSFLTGEGVPDYVKVANFSDHGSTKRRDQDYGLIVVAADGMQQLYPVYDKAHTWASAKFLSDNWTGMPKNAAAIAARSIAGMADIFEIDIPLSIKKLAALAPEKTGRYYEPSSSDLPIFEERPLDDKIASIKVGELVFPVRGFAELSEAERWFDSSHFDLNQADKYKMAGFLAQRREELSSDEEMMKASSWMYKSEEVGKVAELTEVNETRFSVEMIKRANLCQDNDLFKAYSRLSADPKIAMMGGPLAAIDMVETLDVNSGLRGSYGTWIPDAIGAVLQKKAAPAAELPAETQIEFHNVKQGGMVDFENGLESDFLPAGRVKKALESPQVQKLLGPKIAAELIKNPAQISNLHASMAGFIYDVALTKR